MLKVVFKTGSAVSAAKMLLHGKFVFVSAEVKYFLKCFLEALCQIPEEIGDLSCQSSEREFD